MIPALNASSIYSKLGNSNSLVPLAIKDIANSLGLTTGSYITGDKLEGKDRFLDEFGTQAIWLFGLPTFKKITDLTLYKLLKIDPKVDVRNLKNPEIMEKAKQYSPEFAKNIDKVLHNPKFAKNLAIGKFSFATLMTILSYTALTKYRHKQTEKAAKAEILAEMNSKNSQTPMGKPDSKTFNKIIKADKQPSFTGLQSFMFDPVKNLMIVDGTITTERLSTSRNKQDFIGYTIKEGATWSFMYFASKPLQKFFEKKAAAKNRPVDLDARVIESKELKTALEKGVENDLATFYKAAGNDLKLYDFINQNSDNFVVKMAKKSDIITTLKNSDKIDNRAFIDLKEVKDVANKIKNLNEKYKSSNLELDKFLGEIRKFKRGATLKNIGICIAALGVAVPAIMVAVRKLNKDNNAFQVKEDLKKELATNNKI